MKKRKSEEYHERKTKLTDKFQQRNLMLSFKAPKAGIPSKKLSQT